MKPTSCFVVILCTILSTLCRPADAHPHVWVDYYVKAVSGKDGIDKLVFTWRFDAMFSTMTLGDMKITKIGEAETKKLHDKAFINLTHYHYYINLLLDGQVFEPKEASEFTARMHGRNLEYRFTVTLPHPAKKLELSIYDPEFYVDLGPPMQQVTPEKAASVMTTGIYEPKDFLSAGATDGAAPPECGYKKGDPHVSAVWGVFTVFLINCAVKQ